MRTVTLRTLLDSKLTDCLEFFIAITAAMKNVLSPISETKIIPHDFKKPVAKPPASKLVMLVPLQPRLHVFLSSQQAEVTLKLWPEKVRHSFLLLSFMCDDTSQSSNKSKRRQTPQTLRGIRWQRPGGGGQVLPAKSCLAADNITHHKITDGVYDNG